MSKFYAVKIGRKKGVFSSWSECQKQVSGYSGAIFKSFKMENDAISWLKESSAMEDKNEKNNFGKLEPPVATIASSESLHIYTDGSDRQGRLGYGAWCRWKGVEYFLGGVLNVQVGSNPTAELFAFVEVLERFRNVKLSVPIVFRQDYEGIEKWMTGQWKAKEPHIIALLDRAKEARRTIKGEISFEWVKGHSGNEGNDRADRLAGGKETGDNFALLVEIIGTN